MMTLTQDYRQSNSISANKTATMTAATTTNSGGGGKPLQHAYCFWYMRRGKGSGGAGGAGAGGAPPTEAAATAEGGVSPETKSPQSQPGENAGGGGGTTSQATTPAASGTATTATAAVNPYEHSIKTIATVTTVEEFWRVYDYLTRPNDLPNTTDYHFFRRGIKPTWEDPGNARGGKWIVRLRKGLSSRYWEEILLALIGGQFIFPGGAPDGDQVCGAVVSIRYSEDIISVWNRRADDRDATDRIRDAIKKILRLPPNAYMEYKPHQASLQDKSSFRNTTVWKPKSSSSTTISASEHHAPHRGDPRSGSLSERGEHHSARRSNSWGEREKPSKRDTERSWR